MPHTVIDRIRRRTRPLRAGAVFPLTRLLRQPLADSEAEIRARASRAFLGHDRAVCQVLGRYKMFVDTTDLDISTHLQIDGYWELWVTQALVALVEPGMVCVDIGAHLGYFTLLLADLTGPNGQVHAFEPNPALRALLDHSVRVNGFAEIVRSHGEPLSDQDDSIVELVVPPGQPGGAHLRPLARNIAPAGALRTRRLDGIAGLDRVDVIKIDAEASEEAIWQGMRGILARGQPLIVLLEFTLARYGDPAAFLASMLGEGFLLRHVDPQHGICPVDRAAVLGAPIAADQMLVLTR